MLSASFLIAWQAYLWHPPQDKECCWRARVKMKKKWPLLDFVLAQEFDKRKLWKSLTRLLNSCWRRTCENIKMADVNQRPKAAPRGSSSRDIFISQQDLDDPNLWGVKMRANEVQTRSEKDPLEVIEEAFEDIQYDEAPKKVPFARSPLPAVKVDDNQAVFSIVSKMAKWKSRIEPPRSFETTSIFTCAGNVRREHDDADENSSVVSENNSNASNARIKFQRWELERDAKLR